MKNQITKVNSIPQTWSLMKMSMDMEFYIWKKKMLYETKSKKTFTPQAIPVLLADVVTHPHKHTHTHTNQPTRYLDTKKGSTELLKMHVPVVS